MVESFRAQDSRPWSAVVQSPVPRSTVKPRKTGLTMVIDKGLGLTQTSDLLDLASDHIDLMKLAFGTSTVYPHRKLLEKIALIKSYGIRICPGGTLLEVAVAQGTAAEFLLQAKKVGFSHVEVSDGTIELPATRRRDLIHQALETGLGVVTEVGKKDRRQTFTVERIVAQVDSDLRHGASHVIIEARDSGRGIGVFDDDGNPNDNLVDAIIRGVDEEQSVMWEAPLVKQQQYFLLRFGAEANLGNVQPQDVITLESTRRGLRGETLRQALNAVQDTWPISS